MQELAVCPQQALVLYNELSRIYQDEQQIAANKLSKCDMKLFDLLQRKIVVGNYKEKEL
jgi:hypothetical protein